MENTLKKDFYEKFKHDKIKINLNKNPIEMVKFLSFLTVDTVRSYDHLGSENLWTRLDNKELKLVIGGGIVNGIEYLDSLMYGTKLSNPYNNYVNPFYLFDILSDEGKKFFINYYKEDFDRVVAERKNAIKWLISEVAREKELLKSILAEIETITPQ